MRTFCVALVLPPHTLMAGGATQICMEVMVLPVPRSADPSLIRLVQLQLLQLALRQDADRSCQRVDRPPQPLVCPCHRHVIDLHGDHIHTCKQHTRSTKDAHETILDAPEKSLY